MKNEVYNLTKTRIQHQEEFIKMNIDQNLEIEREKFRKLEENFNQVQLKVRFLNSENNLLNEKLNKLENEKNIVKDVEQQYNEMKSIILNGTFNPHSETTKNDIKKTIERNKNIENSYQKLVYFLCNEGFRME